MCLIDLAIAPSRRVAGRPELLLAMVEEPDKIKVARDKIAELGSQTFEELCSITRDYRDGVIDWMGLWSHEKVRTNQCDFSVMISPEMFRDYVLEDLESTYEPIDHGIYHLDGEEQIRHLDILLSIEKLKVIQWVPSSRANQPEYKDPMNWIDLFKRIQKAGKSVLINTPHERVSELLRKIDPSKVVLDITCPDVDSANRTILELEKVGA